MTIGARLRELREARGLSQVRLARASGLSRTFVWEVEHDQTSPSARSIEQLARILDVPPASLFDGASTSAIEGSTAIDGGGAGVVPSAGGPRPASKTHVERVETLLDGEATDTYVQHFLVEGRRVAGHVTVILSDDLAPRRERSAWHLHPGQFGSAICAVLEGTYEAMIDGRLRLVRAGQVIELTHDTQHTWRLIGDAPGRALLIRFEDEDVTPNQVCPLD